MPKLARTSSLALGALASFTLAAPVAFAPSAAQAQFVCQGAAGSDGAVATNPNAVACGTAAQATADSSTAIGQNSVASGLQSTADGFNSRHASEVTVARVK